ncbi:prepilin-type N-terminal cleavage/methylation domain-containing protein [Propionivibrio sp.]|uniref:prepilin-type N-terminal cleavage/methylation domain-containing protein n=1 Tax=Propionivibrio sp. TaxID=2212460 RepID=UPI003BF3569E
MNRQQSGFTLVEIAIVLVIIGLLLGGVLKGQELINSAKAKNLANDFRTVPIFIYGYQDKFKRLPGDDDSPNASRFPDYKKATLAGQTQKNGTIEGIWNSTDVTSENVLFWQHVRGVGLAAGSTDFSDTTKASLPSNAEGGKIGIQMTPPITGMSGTYYLCSENINTKIAQQLDTTVDDGKPDSGTMRAQAKFDDTEAGDKSWPASGSVIVCMSM